MSKQDDSTPTRVLSKAQQQEADIQEIRKELSAPMEMTPEQEAKYQAMVLRFFPVSPLDSDITIH